MPFGLGLFETFVVFLLLLALPATGVVLVVRALRGRQHDPLAALRTEEELESARHRLRMLEARLARTEEKAAGAQSLLDDGRQGSHLPTPPDGVRGSGGA